MKAVLLLMVCVALAVLITCGEVEGKRPERREPADPEEQQEENDEETSVGADRRGHGGQGRGGGNGRGPSPSTQDEKEQGSHRDEERSNGRRGRRGNQNRWWG